MTIVAVSISTFQMIPDFERIVGRPHHVYTQTQIQPILSRFAEHPTLTRGTLSQISRDTGIPRQTLRDWHMKLQEPGNEDWFPQAYGHPNRRVFAATTDAAI
jgi:hypothetical protein